MTTCVHLGQLRFLADYSTLPKETRASGHSRPIIAMTPSNVMPSSDLIRGSVTGIHELAPFTRGVPSMIRINNHAASTGRTAEKDVCMP